MKIYIRDDLCTAETDYGTILLDERAGRYYLANPTAAIIVEELKNGSTVDRAAKRLIGSFGITETEARNDVDALLDQLTRLGLVQK